jgi:hypothetical protein
VRSRAVAERFIRLLTSSTIYRPDGRIETTKDLAVWTRAHRGYSGGGRLDIWVYRSEAEALAAGALLAMECGLDEDPRRAPPTPQADTGTCSRAMRKPARSSICSAFRQRSFKTTMSSDTHRQRPAGSPVSRTPA